MSWLSGYGYRKQIDLSSASVLTDYTVKLEVDTTNLISNSKMLPDGIDIRFTDNTGTTEIPFWVNPDTINTATTEIYVKTNVDTNTTIYMYYGNSGATSSSNGKNTFVYYEDFENYVGADGTTPSDWNTYSGGDVQLYTDNGDRVALKTTQNDPNGGSVALGETLTDFEVVLHEKRINTTGGSRDRWSMGDSNANGVGWQYYATGNTTFELETRSSGSSQSLDTMTPANITHNQGEWYINKFTKLGTNYTAYAYDMVGNLLGTTTGTESTTYTFTHFYIHGGYEFLTDDIRIRKLVADEPTYTVNSEEVETVNTVNYTYPTDITVLQEGYYIERSTDQTNWEQIAVEDLANTSYDDLTVVNNTTYYYRIKEITTEYETVWSAIQSITYQSFTPVSFSFGTNYLTGCTKDIFYSILGNLGVSDISNMTAEQYIAILENLNYNTDIGVIPTPTLTISDTNGLIEIRW